MFHYFNDRRAAWEPAYHKELLPSLSRSGFPRVTQCWDGIGCLFSRLSSASRDRCGHGICVASSHLAQHTPALRGGGQSSKKCGL